MLKAERCTSGHKVLNLTESQPNDGYMVVVVKLAQKWKMQQSSCLNDIKEKKMTVLIYERQGAIDQSSIRS